MPNEFVIKNGFISKGNSIVEGGITATTISASTYSNLPSPSITVGTSQLTSGTDTRVLFQSGTTLQQDGNFTFDPTLKRLTLRAVGTAATDIPFRIRNSTDTANIFTVTGDNQVWSNGSGNISSNTSFGEESLKSNTTGQFNTAYGKNSLRVNTTGQINTAIGFDVLRTNTTGSNNTALGTNALFSNLGGSSNLAIGNSPLYNNTSGVSNIAIGDGSLQTNTIGSYNTSIGSSSLFLNTSGQYNVAYGISVLRSNTTGQINTAIGHESLFANTTGNNNAAIGWNSGRYILGGVTSNTITNNSVFLGAQTKALADNQTNQIVIGYDSTGLGSNTTVIGNSSTTLFRPYGSVAIGADSASARLDVRAQGALSTDIAFRVRNSADSATFFTVRGDQAIEMIRENPSTNGGILITKTDNYNSPRIQLYDVFGQQVYIDGASKLIATNNLKCGNTGNGYIGLVTTTGQDRFLKFVNVFGDESLSIGGNNYDGYATMHIKGPLSYDANLIRVSKLDNTNNFVVSDRANVALGGTTFGTSARHVLAQYTGVAPTTSPIDAFQQYSADITAGNAAPHFRTEAGDIIKLYKETTAVAAATLVSNAGTTITDTDTFDGYTLQQVVKALRNLGILQ